MTLGRTNLLYSMVDVILYLRLRMQLNHFHMSEKHNILCPLVIFTPYRMHVTLAKYIFSKLLLLSVILTGDGVLRRRERQKAEKKCEMKT